MEASSTKRGTSIAVGWLLSYFADQLGYVDPKRIGINGHSYGGEGAAFIGTRSKMFAAVGMAPA